MILLSKSKIIHLHISEFWGFPRWRSILTPAAPTHLLPGAHFSNRRRTKHWEKGASLSCLAVSSFFLVRGLSYSTVPLEDENPPCVFYSIGCLEVMDAITVSVDNKVLDALTIRPFTN
jgi:hypothetical protein